MEEGPDHSVISEAGPETSYLSSPPPKTYSGLHSPSSSTLGSKVTLEVSSRRFVTTMDTLAGATYFQALLSGRWKAQDDGSFFIDADPRLFEHILSFLRHNTLPLFYDRTKGHDHGLYMALLGEAEYLGVEGLVRYLREKVYLQVVKVRHSAEELNTLEDVDLIVGMDTEVEYHVVRNKKKVYVCPRSISLHRGQPQLCGRQCQNAKGGAGNLFEDENVMKLVRVKRQLIVDERVGS